MFKAGQLIKEARTKKKMTQTELANKLGLATITIRQYENGTREPKLETMRKIAEVLGISISSILPEQPNDPVVDRLTSDFSAKLFAHMEKAKQLDDEYNRMRGYDADAWVDEIAYRPRYDLMVTLITENTLDHLDKCLTIMLSDAESENKLDAAMRRETNALQNSHKKD